MRNRAFCVGCACVLAVSIARAAQLKPKTIAAWNQYIQSTEARIQQDLHDPGRFLWVDGNPERLKQVRDGQIVTRSRNEGNPVSIPDGLIHDWIGALFIPGATLGKALSVMQDYDHHQVIYKPDVLASRLLVHEGNQYKYYRMRQLKKGFLSAVLNTSYEGRYTQIDPHRWYYRTVSTHIAQVEDAGKPNQHELPEGNDEGYLWRLNAYWKLLERDGGTYVECEAISLTRTVPLGLGWMVEPVIRALPRESLAATLRDTRAAVK